MIKKIFGTLFCALLFTSFSHCQIHPAKVQTVIDATVICNNGCGAVCIHWDRNTGTGYLATAYHCVSSKDTFKFKTTSGQEIFAAIKKISRNSGAAYSLVDPQADCAIAIFHSRTPVVYSPLAKRNPTVGTSLYKVGFAPKYQNGDRSLNIKVGNVRSVNSKQMYMNLVLRPGDSGGGIFNKQGELVGISSAYLTETPNISIAAVPSAIDRLLASCPDCYRWRSPPTTPQPPQVPEIPTPPEVPRIPEVPPPSIPSPPQYERKPDTNIHIEISGSGLDQETKKQLLEILKLLREQQQQKKDPIPEPLPPPRPKGDGTEAELKIIKAMLMSMAKEIQFLRQDAETAKGVREILAQQVLKNSEKISQLELSGGTNTEVEALKTEVNRLKGLIEGLKGSFRIRVEPKQKK